MGEFIEAFSDGIAERREATALCRTSSSYLSPLNLNETHPACGWRVHSRLGLKVSSIRSTIGSKSARTAVG
jgi:hypothetical protein